MKIATLNLGHRALRPKAVPTELLDALVDLDTDLLVLTEYVSTASYDEALRARWPHLAASPLLPYDKRGRWSNQVVALSRRPLTVRPGHIAEPTQCAATNFLSVEVDGLVVTGLRAPAYKRASDWYGYWHTLRTRLDGDVVIGDLNVDPSRTRKRDRVLPTGWRVVTPGGCSFRNASSGAESAIDHALVREHVAVRGAAYRPELFGRWGLDHCPLVVEVGTGRSA